MAPDLTMDACELPCGCRELNPGSAERAASGLNCQAIYPAPNFHFYKHRIENLSKGHSLEFIFLFYICECDR